MDLIQVKEGQQQKKAGMVLFELLLTLALSVGCWYSYFSMFPAPVGQGPAIGLMLLLPAAFYGAAQNKYVRNYLIFGVFILVAIYFVIAYKAVWNGFLVLANIVVEIINEQTGTGLIGYAADGDETVWMRDAAMALVPVMLLVSAAIVFAVRQKAPLGGFILTALPVLIGLCLKGIPSVWLLILLMMGWTGLFVLCAVEPPENRGKKKFLYLHHEKRSGLPFIFLGAVLVLALVYVLLFSGEDYRPFEKVEQVRTRLVAAEEHLRYDRLNGEETDGLSRGDLEDAHPLNYTDAAVLELEMEAPHAMYLRSFAGSEYEDRKWNDTAEWPYTEEYKGITQWLAKEGFYPWCQQDALYRMAPNYDFVEVKVKNINASSKYTYLPYETAMSGEITPDKVNFKRDQALCSRGLRGDREYTFTMFLSDFEDYEPEKIEKWMQGIRRNAEYESYKEKEQIYRRFVYDTYLLVPEEAEKALAGSGIEKCLGRTIAYTLHQIRAKFDEEFQYDVSYSGAPEGKDELAYFMKQSKTGNDMHFAAAAALMLRKAGIPARYAEGYYLSPEYMEGYTQVNNVKLAVTDSMAHSWTEIYIDEVGWFPVEVIPGYYTLKKEKTKQKEEEESIVSEQEKIQPDEREIDDEPDKKNPKEEKHLHPVWIILAVLLLLIALYEFLGRMYLRKMLRGFAEEQSRRQVYLMYRYISRLLAFDGMKLSENPYDRAEEAEKAYDGHTALRFREFLRLINQVRFGDRDLQPEEYKKTAAYANALSRHIYQKQTKGKKFLMKFIFFYV